jgi:DNA-binding SARP family transcriptional activator
VRWIPTGPSEVDVLRFRDAMAVGDLELAARLYSGDLLPACYDDWVLDERAKLRGEAYRAFAAADRRGGGARRPQATIEHARRVIELEPTDEAAVRAQMEAHLALGDRAAALRSYHRYAEVLERELEVAPARRSGPCTDSSGPARTATTARTMTTWQPLAESPFVGRDLELNQLSEAWNTAREGGAHLCW